MHHVRSQTIRNLDAVIDSLEARLRDAARSETVTDELVRAYCADHGRVHWRFERVLLLEAFKSVNADDLIRRLMSDLRRRLRGGAHRVALVGEPSLAYLASLLDSGSAPIFLGLERLIRFGRLSQQTRVYVLYWQRLRDYLLWRVADGA